MVQFLLLCLGCLYNVLTVPVPKLEYNSSSYSTTAARDCKRFDSIVWIYDVLNVSLLYNCTVQSRVQRIHSACQALFCKCSLAWDFFWSFKFRQTITENLENKLFPVKPWGAFGVCWKDPSSNENFKPGRCLDTLHNLSIVGVQSVTYSVWRKKHKMWMLVRYIWTMISLVTPCVYKIRETQLIGVGEGDGGWGVGYGEPACTRKSSSLLLLRAMSSVFPVYIWNSERNFHFPFYVWIKFECCWIWWHCLLKLRICGHCHCKP